MKYILCALFFIYYIFLPAQELIKFQVEAGDYDRMDCPVVLSPLPDVIFNETDGLRLIEITDNNPSSVIQIDKNTGELWTSIGKRKNTKFGFRC